MAEPLLFVPGIGADARLFMPQIVSLSREMIVAAAPGGRGERVEEIASDILSSAPSKFALCGHGLGGMVALEMVRRAPDRVTRLCLISSSPLAETPQDAAERESRIIAARAGRFEDAISAEIQQNWLAPTQARAEILARFAAMARMVGSETFVRQSRALQRRRDQQATLRKLKQKVLVICGEYDGLYPVRRQEFMAELIPHAQLYVLPDAGHLPTLEQANAVTIALRDFMLWPL